MDTLPFAAVGTCIKNRKQMPSFTITLKKSKSDFKSNNNGTIAVRWQDTREVLLLSNCHTDSMGQIQKDGSRKSTTCPTAIQFYREKMGEVDRADQMAGIYELDRKSGKWWKKVFYRLLMHSAVNAWIKYKELHRNSKQPFFQFLMELAEQLIEEGRTKAVVKSAGSIQEEDQNVSS